MSQLQIHCTMNDIQAEFELIRKEFVQHATQGNYASALNLVKNPQLKKTLKHEFVNKRFIWLDNTPLFEELKFDLYSMDIDSIEILQQYIINSKPNMVVECGGGASSIILSHTMKDMQLKDSSYHPHYVSIESDMKYFEMYSELAHKYDLDTILTYEHSTLVSCTAAGNISDFYDLSSIIQKNSIADIDLLIVDGPIGHQQYMARRPGYYIAKPFLAPSFSIFLDDTDREDEKSIISEWSEDIPNSVVSWYESIAQISC